jgi:molecular chaperone DnaK
MTGDMPDSEGPMNTLKYFGIDLGTTNSAVAVFEETDAKVILNERGEVYTPSVVRVTASKLVIGEKARKHLYTDPANTFKEFKRLMGANNRMEPDMNGKRWSPEGLSSEVLKRLKALAEQDQNCDFDKVVITVPALFEIPQSKATADAGRLAGFEKVELLPEPVASGLAAGWSDEASGKPWLVYDLGGGTFDASLLEARDGLLRVVAHDGDNFLGGRDIDMVIVHWLLDELSAKHNCRIEPEHPDYVRIKRTLEALAEHAKIKLSGATQSLIELEFNYDGQDFEIDIPLSREKLRSLCEPIITKSIFICQRLLLSQGLKKEQLHRVVLVGGPAHMPIVQEMVSEKLAPLAEHSEDPMSIVAKGAALYAATINLSCQSKEDTKADEAQAEAQIWLQYPSVCTELTPTVMGRIIDDELNVQRIKLMRADGTWESDAVAVDDSGLFIVEARITSGQKASFTVAAWKNEAPVPLSHPPIHILHGLSMSDPPLSRSIGLALADGWVQTFVERGTPLPAKRTFTQSTVDTLVSKSGKTLNIPIVQGERRNSRFCRKVGNLVIDSNDLKHDLHVGSAVEITIEVDRGGNLKAQAFLPDQQKIIHGLAHLMMTHADPDTLRATSHALGGKISTITQQAFRERDEATIKAMEPLNTQFQELLKDLMHMGTDTDTCQRISRNLMDIESEVEQIESKEQIRQLSEECEVVYYNTKNIVENYGDATDKRVLGECANQFASVIAFPRLGELERLIERLETLYHAADTKSPDYWKECFTHWASMAHQAENLKEAQSIVDQGYKAIHDHQMERLPKLTNALYNLIPQQYKGANSNHHDSGIF